MSDVEQLYRRIRRQRRILRLMGLFFVLFASAMIFPTIGLLLDPASTIVCNGVVTTSFGCKLSLTLFGGFLLLVGLGCLCTPRRYIDRALEWKESLWSLICHRN